MKRPWTYSAIPSRPSFRWPGGAKVALWVAVGVESYRNDDGRTEDILPRGPAPDLVNAAWRDYGNRVGAFRLFDRLAGIGIRPTVLLNTDVYDEAPDVIAAARAANAEIVAHGKSNSDALPEMSDEAENAYIRACRSKITREEGVAPGGWSSPWLQHRPTTLRHLKQAGFDYVLDFHLDDQPVWLDTDSDPILAIPYASELNDSTTMIGRLSSAESFARMIEDEFEELSSGGYPAVMSLVLHSFISGRAHRMLPLVRALEKILAQSENVWSTTPHEIFSSFSRPD